MSVSYVIFNGNFNYFWGRQNVNFVKIMKYVLFFFGSNLNLSMLIADLITLQLANHNIFF